MLYPNPSGGSGIYTQHTWFGEVGPLNNYFIESPSFRSMIPGNYDLTYRVRDDKGCYGTGDVRVVVDAPDATFTQDVSYMCTPGTVTFTKDMTGIASFTWDFDDGTTNTVDASPVHVFTNTNPGAIEYHNVKLTVLSPGGCSAEYTQLVTVYPAIDATFTASNDISLQRKCTYLYRTDRSKQLLLGLWRWRIRVWDQFNQPPVYKYRNCTACSDCDPHNNIIL